MAESEKTLERVLKRLVQDDLGGLCLKLVATHVIGLPDRLCLLPGGRIFFAEVKSSGERPRKIQLHWHRKLRGLGFKVEVIDSAEAIEKALNEYR